MRKIVLIILLVLTVSGCEQKTETEIYKSEWQKGFELGYKSSKDIDEMKKSGFSAGFDAGMEKAENDK